MRPLTKKRILIIDDEVDLVVILKLRLEPTYHVIEAHDGAEGLEKAVSVAPDLILLDIKMPKLDGFEVLKHLKSNNKTRSIPVIMLTSEARNSSILKAQDEQVTDYAIKPFELDTLLPFIARYI